MTSQTIPTLHIAVSILSIPPRVAVALDDGDVSVTATFRPHDPIGSTQVSTSIDLLDDDALLNLLDATIARLTAYRGAYQGTRDEDAATVPPPPLPLPTPWYAW